MTLKLPMGVICSHCILALYFLISSISTANGKIIALSKVLGHTGFLLIGEILF